jgi:photosystem II stability/assembly factor-like uncharacterized protein
MRLAVLLAAVMSGVAIGAPDWQQQVSGTTERFRGVSAINARVAWASGNKGTVVRTTDGGATWRVLPVPGAEALDFRDIEGFGSDTAYILSIGPGDRSRVYKTADGGNTWALQFRNPDPKAFFDAIAFWDEATGVAIGDPVDGRFAVARTTDGGRSWLPLPPSGMPPALPGDGAFAASGTCLVAAAGTHAWFGTGGGARARVFHTFDRGLTWTVADTPIAAGTSSAGIFSVAFRDARHGIAVGGDYRKEGEPSENVAVTSDGGRTWTLAGVGRLRGFRSAVAFVPGTRGRIIVAVGPAGADVSSDGGRTWAPFGELGFHAFSITGSLNAAWAVGEQGRIAKLGWRPR